MKNLLDIEKEIHKIISYINNNDEHIIGVKITQNTLNYLKSKGIYGFSDIFNKEIPILINDFGVDGQIEFIREKNDIATEYEPYEID